MINWIKRLLGLRETRTLRLVPYEEADRLLRQNDGWRVAFREEDRNRIAGYVYMEKRVKTKTQRVPFRVPDKPMFAGVDPAKPETDVTSKMTIKKDCL